MNHRLYGITEVGGRTRCKNEGRGCGTVFDFLTAQCFRMTRVASDDPDNLPRAPEGGSNKFHGFRCVWLRLLNHKKATTYIRQHGEDTVIIAFSRMSDAMEWGFSAGASSCEASMRYPW